MDPITNKELFLAAAAGDTVTLPEPRTREEIYLKRIAERSGPTDEQVTTAVNAYLKKNPVSGLTAAEKTLMLSLFKNAAYTADMSAEITELETLWNGSGGDTGGDDSGDTETTQYTITLDLVNVSSSNSATSVTEGASYTAILTAADGYELSTVTVIMSDVDITATAYADGVISIPAVTGNVEIVASASVVEESEAALPTDGLLAYVDLRTIEDGLVGTAGGFYPTEGEGAFFAWVTPLVTEVGEYGAKMNRPVMYSKAGNTTQTDLGTIFTIISFGYGECMCPGVHATNVNVRWQLKPTYYTADGTATATVVSGATLNSDSMTDYNFGVYRVNGNDLTIINDTSRYDYSGGEYDGFVSWESKPSLCRTYYGEGYGTAVALYNRALTDVEIEEARAFMKTLEVTE